MGKAPNNMSGLFEKLHDLKSLFKYGEKIVPIIQSLVDFMQDTVPLLENINHSIADSTAKIPAASNQINNVTSATELATTEILDLVDALSMNFDKVETKVNLAKQKDIEKAALLEELQKEIKKNSKASELLSKYMEMKDSEAALNFVGDLLPKFKDDTYHITLSLQVQDITAQQLAAVNHLIDSVQERLSSLIQDIDSTEIKELTVGKIQAPDGVAFDPNAKYSKSKDLQNMADVIVNNANTSNNNNNKASQDEIDKLFS